MSYFENTAVQLSSKSSASLANSDNLDSLWLDLEKYVSYKISVFADAGELDLVITSAEVDGGGINDTVSTTELRQSFLCTLPIRERYMRFQVVNNTGSAVTNVKFEVFGLPTGIGASVFPDYIAPAIFSPALLTQSILKGENAQGGYNSVRVNNGNALNVSNFRTEIALGNVDNYTTSTKFGGTEAIDAADPEITIWRLANDTLGANQVTRKKFQTSASTLYIASTSASDTSIDITVQYSDSSNLEQSTTVTLNGQTPVSLGVSGLDCNRMFVSSADDTLAGNVYLTNANDFSSGVPNDDADILAYIIAGAQQTEQTTFRVPSDKTMIITRVYATISRANGSSGSANISLKIKPDGGSWLVKRKYYTTTEKDINLNDLSIVYQPGTFVEWTISNVSDNNTNVFVEYDYELISGL
jgi:hypothetical protein